MFQAKTYNCKMKDLKELFQVILLLGFFLLFGLSVKSQITAPNAMGQATTAYSNGANNDPIFVFCTPDNLGNPVLTGSLTATPSVGVAPFSYVWYNYSVATNSWQIYNTQNGVNGPSTISNLVNGGYRVTILDAGGNLVGCYRAWVWVKSTTVDVAAIPAGCTPFQLSGSYSTTETYTYYNPPSDPFLVNASTTITVCVSATHTWVSDLGFYLVGPPSCGSPVVTLSPNPGSIGQGAVCNPGDNVNNLCFTTLPSPNFNACTAGTPYTGTYDSYGPANSAINWAPIFGCDATSGGWSVQIFDCIGSDVGSLTRATLTFAGTSSCGQTTITYDSGNINSVIDDNSCTQATASIYTVPVPVAQSRIYTATTTFSWTGPNITNGNTLTPSVTPVPTSDAWYYLNVTNSVGCTHKDSAFFDYQVPSTPVITPTGPFCVDNVPVTLTADQPGGTWSGVGITDATNGVFDPTLTGPGSFLINYTTPPPCGSAGAITIIVNDLPQLTETHLDESCFGLSDGSIDLTVTNPVAGTQFVWAPGGELTEDITGLSPGPYQVAVQDGNGCQNTLLVTILGQAAPLTATETHIDISCFGGNDGSIDVTPAGGDIPYSFLWVPNGATTEDINGLTAGVYTVTVTDNNNCTFNLPVTLVEPSSMSITETHQDVLCFGQSNGSIDVTVGGGTGPFTFVWSNGAGTEDITGLPANTYSCDITDGLGCLSSVQVVITQPLTALSVTETHVDATCFGYCDGSIDITATGGTGAYSYLWAPNNTTLEDPTNICAGSYGVIVSDANGCPFTLPVTVSEPAQGIGVIGVTTSTTCNAACDGSIDITVSGGTGAYSYVWTNGAGTNEDPSNLCAGTYVVTVTDATGVCSFTSLFDVIEPTPVEVIVSSNETICIGNSTNLNATASGGNIGAYSFSWNSSPLDNSMSSTTINNPVVTPTVVTDYTVTATDINNCVSLPQTLTISLAQPLDLTVTLAGPNPICIGENSAFTFSATGGDGNFIYTLNGAPVTSPFSVAPLITTTYVILVNDGCATPFVTDSVIIQVNPLPAIQLSTLNNSGCEDFRANFQAYTTNVDGLIWEWDFGDPTSASNSVTTTPDSAASHLYEDPGSYTISLTVTSTDNCINSETFTNFIVVNPVPTAGFTGSPSVSDILNPTIVFYDQSVGASEWLYDFLDGTTSTDQNPSHAFTDTGYFEVQQIVTTDSGCTDVAYNTIYITPVYSLYVPNAFTPNNNGKNETFNAMAEGYIPDTYEMRIYNRWGEEVFRTKSFDANWDGRRNGVECEGGVYSYMIKIRSAQDYREKYLKGRITLVR